MGRWFKSRDASTQRIAGPEVSISAVLCVPAGLGKIFDPSTMLTRHSPGLIPAQPSELLFSLYDPDNVLQPVRESWGDEPLAPLTWGPDIETADTVPDTV